MEKHKKNILLYWSTIEIDIILYYIYAAIDEEETELYTTKKERNIYLYTNIYSIEYITESLSQNEWVFSKTRDEIRP